MSEPILIQLREEDGEVTEECLGTLFVEYAGKPKVMVQMAIEPLEGEDDLWVYFEDDDPEHPAIPRMFRVSDGCYSFAAIGCDEIVERCFDEDSGPAALARFAQIYAAAARLVDRAKQEQPVFYGYRDLERHQHHMRTGGDRFNATEPPPEPNRSPGKRRKKS
ncbi:MAG: hypothetical protein NW206_09530 [Hyphomonadaceae bacterium]|nr:hypothetical protein [Hyphomonadaceae bacterium]